MKKFIKNTIINTILLATFVASTLGIVALAITLMNAPIPQ